jgi:hypothetical protein
MEKGGYEMTNHPNQGHYRLYDRVKPPLKTGSYKLKIDQTVSKGSSTYSGSYSRYFDVQGPQWVLPPSQVHSVYPPDGDEEAPPLSQIPFITLGRRSLPWERELGIPQSILTDSTQPINIDPDLSESDYPWVALLVFREDELEWTDGTGKTHLNIFKGEDAISNTSVSPTLPGAPPQMVNIVRPHIDTLKSIMPKLDELRLLCHARQVNPRDKELCGNDDDGWFSVVMSNRVLLPNMKYHACLVSLEGRWGDFLNEINPSNPRLQWNPDAQLANDWACPHNNVGYSCLQCNGTVTIAREIKPQFMNYQPKVAIPNQDSPSSDRFDLVLLHHWSFTSAESGMDFQKKMEQINSRVAESNSPNYDAGDLIPLDQVPVENVATAGSIKIEPSLLGTESVPGMTSNSYLSTEMVGANGLSESVVYRGPLVAYPETHNAKLSPYTDSDAAMALVQQLGIWDISHSSAFELGRLLALGDAQFLRSMKEWISQDIQKQQHEEAQVSMNLKDLTYPKVFQHLKSIANNQPFPKVRAGVIQQIQPQQTVDVEEDVEAFDDMAAEYVNHLKNLDTTAISHDKAKLQGGDNHGSK